MNNEERGSFTIPEIKEMLHVSKVTAYAISKEPLLERRMILGQYRILKTSGSGMSSRQNTESMKRHLIRMTISRQKI